MKKDLERVKSAIDCHEYIGQKLEIKVSTKARYKCPFCGARHGFSLYISKNGEKLYKCHACGKGGDVIAFEQEYSSCDFKTAIEHICQNEGLPIPDSFARQKRERASRPESTTTITITRAQRQETCRKKEPQQEKEPEGKSWKEILESCEKIAILETLEKWLLDERNFGSFAVKAAEVARQECRGVYEHKGHHNFVFPIYAFETGEIVGVQQIAQHKDSDGHNWKGFGAGSKGSGFLPFIVGYGPIVIVESVANALALAVIGISAICIYTKGNAGKVEQLQKLFPGKKLVLWLDHDAEQLQREIMQQCGIAGIFFSADKSAKYDVNDLLRDTQEEFPKVAQSYLDQATFYPIPGVGEILDYFPLSAYLEASGIAGICPDCKDSLDLSGEIYSRCKCGLRDILDWHALLEQVTRAKAAQLLSAKIAAHKAQQEALRKIKDAPAIEENKSREILGEMLAGKWLFLTWPTGTGKTATALSACLELARQGKPFCWIAPDRESMMEAAAIYRDLATAHGVNASLVMLYQETSDDFSRADAALARFTHPGYLGYKALTPAGYVQFHRIISGAHVVIDEAHLLERQICLASPLYASYVLLSSAWRKVSTCPAKSGKGDCSTCARAHALIEERHSREHNKRIAVADFDKYKSLPTAHPSFAKADDWEKYDHVWGCTFLQRLEAECSYSKLPETLYQSQRDKSEEGYYREVMKTLINPVLISESPIRMAENAIIRIDPNSPEAKEKTTIFPKYPCMVPELHGRWIFPLLQLAAKAQIEYVAHNREFRENFNPPLSVTFASATLPKLLEDTVAQVANAYQKKMVRFTLPVTPWKFKVAVLRTSRKIPIKAIIQATADRKEKTLVALRTKRDAKDTRQAFRAAYRGKIAWFYEQDFSYEPEKTDNKQSTWNVLLSYIRAAIYKQFGFPECQIGIVDGSTLPPTKGLPDIFPGMSKEEKTAIAVETVNGDIEQFAGRFFRSDLPYIEGETQLDQRQIVIVMHDLGEDFYPAAVLDESLCWELHYFDETWLSSEKETESLIDSLDRVLRGEAPQDWSKIDKEATMKKAIKGGLDALSKAQREIVADTLPEERQELRGLELEVKVAKAAKEGEKWSAISHKWHLDRLPKKEQIRLKQIFYTNQTET